MRLLKTLYIALQNKNNWEGGEENYCVQILLAKYLVKGERHVTTVLGDRVIVKRKIEEEKTKSGIVLPDTAKEKPLEGEVIAVGGGRVLDNGQRNPIDVKKGDTVLFAKYGGTEVKYKDEDYVILEERDVLAIVK